MFDKKALHMVDSANLFSKLRPFIIIILEWEGCRGDLGDVAAESDVQARAGGR